MFTAIINEDDLAQTLDTVSALVAECKIHLDEDGLRILAVDPANVAMIRQELDKETFESYEADGGTIGVNLDRLEDIVGMADSGQFVELELNDETRKLHITIDGLEYTLALIDPDSIRQEPEIPDLDLPAEVVMEGHNLARGVKAADMVSDHISLGMREAGVFYMAAEGDTDEVRQEFVADDVIALEPADAHSLFSLDYLKDMDKAIPKDAEVTLRLAEEHPLKMHFETSDGFGEATYMLAPRISSD